MNFTLKEYAVMGLLAEGLKPGQIQTRLHISRGRFDGTRRRVMHKLGAVNDTQLGVLLERYQLVPVDRRNSAQDRIGERMDARRSLS